MLRISQSLLLYCIISLFLAFSGCSSTAPSTTSSRAGAPGWIRDPYSIYDKQANVAAVGMGSTRELAEKSALGNLVAIFGQSIQVDETVSTSYEQALRSGAIATWSERTASESTISTSASMDSLIGAEIGDTWYDGRNDYYAVAVLNKSKAALIYSDLIRSNQALIANLVAISPEGRNTLDGFARYHLAAVVADMVVSYSNLLSVIGVPAQRWLPPGTDYRLEANTIARTIPVGLSVQNDKAGRIQGAFAKALTTVGFQSGGINSRYILEVIIETTPISYVNNPIIFTRIEISANLRDTEQGTVLLPYNFDLRDGHSSQSEADNRAYQLAERKINDEYAKYLTDYLSQLLPAK